MEEDTVLLQTFLGVATSVGSLSYGLIVLSKNNQCMISRQYLLQSSIFGIGNSILRLIIVTFLRIKTPNIRTNGI